MHNVRYQALGPLLSGEGSRAFLGLQITSDHPPKPIVLVWVPEAAASDEQATLKLAHETARAAALQHPNIIRVFGLAQVDEGLARVVEYLDGETVRKVLDVAGTLPPKFAAFIAAEAAMGVHFAHLTGNTDGTPLVHGDLRPDTLLVSFSGVCKVSGYGALSVAPKEMHGKRVKGRRAYAAPEQILGGREAAIRETDVYLLGILLYECLTGMIPFGEEPNFEDAILNQPLRLNLDAIPPKLVDIIGKATAKRAQERFTSALAFREAIERATGGLPSSEEFGVFLKTFFPEADHSRAARKREIDAGVAEYYRRQGGAPTPPTPPVPAAAVPTPKAVEAPVMAEPERKVEVKLEPEPKVQVNLEPEPPTPPRPPKMVTAVKAVIPDAPTEPTWATQPEAPRSKCRIGPSDQAHGSRKRTTCRAVVRKAEGASVFWWLRVLLLGWVEFGGVFLARKRVRTRPHP